MMKLLEHQVEGREIAFVDRAVVVANKDFTQDAVDLVLHVLQFIDRVAVPRPGNESQRPIPQRDAFGFFVPLHIAAEPGAGRSKAGQQQDSRPHIVAVFLKKRPLGAIDIGRRAAMRGQGRGLVGVRGRDVGGRGQLPSPEIDGPRTVAA